MRQSVSTGKPGVYGALTVYESVHHVGGNCRTVGVSNVGQAIPGELNTLKRWVDIGVNDFNKNSYVNIVQMLDALHVPYGPLEDTISFFGVGNGSNIPSGGYTTDETWGNKVPDTIKLGSGQFKEYVSNNINQFLTPSGKFYHAKMYDFLTDPEVNGQYSELNMNSDFVKYNLFPHINAMFFVTNVSPLEMPARMVIHYFNLQEGYGTGQNAERMYWKEGSHSWIKALEKYLKDQGVKVITHMTAQFTYGQVNEPIRVTTDKGTTWSSFDAVVLGVQAWQLATTFLDPRSIPSYIHEVTSKNPI